MTQGPSTTTASPPETTLSSGRYDGKQFTFTVLGSADDQIRVAFQYADEEVMTDGRLGDEHWLREARITDPSDTRTHWEVRRPLPRAAPLLGVRVLQVTGQDARELRLTQNDFHLKRLYPLTREQFAERFHRQFKRIKDKETLLFVVDQILAYYELDWADRSVAAVIKAYRALDHGNFSECRAALDHITQCQAHVESIADTASTRLGREPLRFSLVVAKYQLLLFLGRTDDIGDGIEPALAIAEGRRFQPIMAFHICRLYLLRGILAVTAGRCEQALADWLSCVAFYKESISRAGKSSINVQELKQAHHCTYVALRLYDYFNGKDDKLYLPGPSEALLRFDDGPAYQRISRLFERMLRDAPRIQPVPVA